MKKKIEVFCVIIFFVFAGNAFAASFNWVGQWAEHRYEVDSDTTSHYLLFDVNTDDPTYDVYVQNVPDASGDLLMNRNPGWDNPGAGQYQYGLDPNVPALGPTWERTYTYYIDLDDSGDFSDGDPTVSSTVPAGYYNPYTPMVLAQNVNISGTYTPTVYWEPASGADRYRVRLFPILDGEPATHALLFDSGNIFEGGPYYHGGETPYFEYTLPSGYFDSDQTLAIGIEARDYVAGFGMVQRSRYLVKHSPVSIPGAVHAAKGRPFFAVLNSGQEVPPNDSNSFGVAFMTFDKKTEELCYSISFTVPLLGIEDPIIGTHFHRGAAGENGPRLFSITGDGGPSPLGSPKNGCVGPLDRSQQKDLKKGLFYINVHSQFYPGGEIRGQVLKQK
jgi:hypothetical protein